MINVAGVNNLLGGAETLRVQLRTVADVVDVIERGIPKAALVAFVERVTIGRLAPSATKVRAGIVSDATFRRNECFAHGVAERLVRLANLRAAAENIIGNAEGANEFLFRGHPELGGQSPFDIAKTEIGARAAEDLLERAAYGLPV